jgi:hypothetical protein
MNVGRGLFRAWILLTVLWLIGAGTMAYLSIPANVSLSKWQYVHHSRTTTPPEEIDWSRPYYEIMRSPSAEKLTVSFEELENPFAQQWEQSVKDGDLIMNRPGFAGGSNS